MKRLCCLSLVLNFFFTMLLPTALYPCECTNSWGNVAKSPEEYIRLASAASKMVFFGKVASIGPTDSEGIYSATFMVEQAWKGVSTASVIITACRSGACAQSSGCPVGLKLGAEYLIFWSGHPLGECSGQIRKADESAQVTDIRPYLQALGKPEYVTK